jgi:HlyD family secretion protein
MVADGSGSHADRRRIKIGRRSAEQVEVLAGLAPGERVITSDYAAFEKVDRVNLAKK